MRFLFCILAVTILSCSIEPEPILYGTDSCHACKMTIMDKKFGAELVTKKGKIYKFDDINCMTNFYNSGTIPKEDFAHKLVIDFSQPGNFIQAETAIYLKSENIKSPMASGLAAFQSENPELAKQWGATRLSWSDLQK